MATLEVPDAVGGRYSVFTSVGLLPAAVAGIDIDQLLAGAADMTRKCLGKSIKNNPAAQYAAVQYLLYRKGKNIRVMSLDEWMSIKSSGVLVSTPAGSLKSKPFSQPLLDTSSSS